MNQRKQWMAFYARADALVEVDAGATKALLQEGRSLLAAGVAQVEGEFEAGQVVEVYSQESHQLIGKGRVRLASADLKAGKAEGVLIHRNDWVSL